MNLKKILKNNDYKVIKLETIPSGHHLIRAKVNGKKGVFILDTGASNTVISGDKSEKYKLKLKNSEHKATGAGTGEIDIKTTGKNSLQIGKWKLKKIRFVSMDLTHINTALAMFNIEVDGIVGSDVLHKGKGIIQYDKNLLFLK